MASFKFVCAFVLALAASSLALPTQMKTPVEEVSYWRKALMDGSMEDLQKECGLNNEIACMKYKVLNFVDEFFTTESFKVTDDMTVVKNDHVADPETSARSADAGFIDSVENYVQSHDVIMALPGSTMTFSPRNLDQDEVNFSLNFGQEEETSVEGKGRKSKVKKILIPILVFVLLKAMTLIPLFIGALGLKAWNALQLSFFSFVISVALAVFQLCKKIAADSPAHSVPIVSAHSPWEYAQHYAARAFDDVTGAHDLAYSAHAE